jgi:hypothetical protein
VVPSIKWNNFYWRLRVALEFPIRYWRASMATDSRVTRLAVDAAKGLPSLGAILGGVGTCSYS